MIQLLWESGMRIGESLAMWLEDFEIDAIRIHIDDVDTNHVFIKLSGKNRYKPMEYSDVVSLFKRLGKKTGVDIMPHILRHTSLTELYKAGWKPEHLQKRAGHKHFQTTLSFYYHPTDEDIRKDWEQAEQRMKLKRRSKGDVEN